jgi:xylose isomerase
VISPEQTEAALYVLKMHGYRGFFGIDINPERMPVEVAVRNSMDALRAANDRVNHLDHETAVKNQSHPRRAGQSALRIRRIGMQIKAAGDPYGESPLF